MDLDETSALVGSIERMPAASRPGTCFFFGGDGAGEGACIMRWTRAWRAVWPTARYRLAVLWRSTHTWVGCRLQGKSDGRYTSGYWRRLSGNPGSRWRKVSCGIETRDVFCFEVRAHVVPCRRRNEQASAHAHADAKSGAAAVARSKMSVLYLPPRARGGACEGPCAGLSQLRAAHHSQDGRPHACSTDLSDSHNSTAERGERRRRGGGRRESHARSTAG